MQAMRSDEAHVVVVVEDDPDTRDALCEALSVFGFRAVAAENGEDALRVLRDVPNPCVILLDMMMPVMDGWEFRAAQQTDARLSEIPVVCLTANWNARDRAIREGCVAFLPKPVEVDTLIDTIRAYC